MPGVIEDSLDVASKPGTHSKIKLDCFSQIKNNVMAFYRCRL